MARVDGIVLDYRFEYFLRGQRIEKRVRGGSKGRRGFGLGAITKKVRSGQGLGNVLQDPG